MPNTTIVNMISDSKFTGSECQMILRVRHLYAESIDLSFCLQVDIFTTHFVGVPIIALRGTIVTHQEKCKIQYPIVLNESVRKFASHEMIQNSQQY
jgi:hypothetical protein